MESNLREYRLEDCMDAIIDYRGKTPKKTTSGIPLITAKIIKNGRVQEVNEFIAEEDYDSWMRRGIPEAGDVVLTTEAPLGEVAQLDDRKIALAQRVITLRGKKGLLDNDYLKYLLLSKEIQHQLDGRGTGTTVKGIKQSELREIKLKFPEFNLQSGIAHVLKTLDDKIELNRKINQTLEQMAQALFKSWFVDFDPVIDNALAVGNDIPEALQHKAEQRRQAQQLPDFKPLPDDIRALFPSEFEQTDEPNIGIAGWIPKGWRVSNTDAELGIKGGSTPSTKNPDFWEGGHVHWTSPKDLSGNDSKILLDTSRKITEAGLAKITSGLLPVDTVLMSSRAPVGYLALAKVPLAINQGYIALKCEKDLTPEYTMQFLDSIMDEIKGISGGTTFAEISKKTFRSIKLVVPSKCAIDAYTAIAKANYDKITENIKQTNSLTETRDYLLPKLISGELQLPDTGQQVEYQ
ncbi:restriction endonuclease subunit S [Alteromonas sp. Mex14]|nr:restriction endonuclease subunit S [Alteromonas sp. Mex14]